MSASAVGGVFISYSSIDRQIVSAAARLLRAAGATVFQDIDDLNFGDNWDQALRKAIGQCERVMVFWSAAAAQSAGVEREWRFALDAGKRIVPMSLDKTPLPPPLAALHGVPDLLDMLRAAMQLAAAEPALQRATTPQPRSSRPVFAVTAGAGLMAAVAYGWLLRTGGSPDDVSRDLPPLVGPGVPGLPTDAQHMPWAAWLVVVVIVAALVAAATVWHRRRAARRRSEAAAEPDTASFTATTAQPDADDWAALGARFASTLFNDH